MQKDELEEDRKPKNMFNQGIGFSGKTILHWQGKRQLDEEIMHKLPNEFRRNFKFSGRAYLEDEHQYDY